MEEERREQVECQRKFEHQIFASQACKSETADIGQLDDYIESLYEDDQVCLCHTPCAFLVSQSMNTDLAGFPHPALQE
jgi:hypothetical protein